MCSGSAAEEVTYLCSACMSLKMDDTPRTLHVQTCYYKLVVVDIRPSTLIQSSPVPQDDETAPDSCCDPFPVLVCSSFFGYCCPF